jgi:D-3-phosphoglycerate dehydrogenase
MKILIAEKIDDVAEELLRERGLQPVLLFLPSREELIETLRDMDGIIVRTKVSLPGEVIKQAPKLKAIGMHGIGLDHIDRAAAEERGIAVLSVPGGNSDAVAELTVGLLLALVRNICPAYNDVRAGQWRADMFLGSQLRDKTLGVIALGRIGLRVAHLCRAFGMRVVAHDPMCPPEIAAVNDIALVAPEVLYHEADIISVHAPLTPSTRHMIGDAAVAAMKPGVIIANLARGGILDEAAMVRGLESGKIRGLCLDVMEQEPPGPGNLLLRFPQVVAVPHMGARTMESQRFVARTIAAKVADVLLGAENSGSAAIRL